MELENYIRLRVVRLKKEFIPERKKLAEARIEELSLLSKALQQDNIKVKTKKVWRPQMQMRKPPIIDEPLIPKVELPKVEFPKAELPKVEIPKNIFRTDREIPRNIFKRDDKEVIEDGN